MGNTQIINWDPIRISTKNGYLTHPTNTVVELISRHPHESTLSKVNTPLKSTVLVAPLYLPYKNDPVKLTA